MPETFSAFVILLGEECIDFIYCEVDPAEWTNPHYGHQN